MGTAKLKYLYPAIIVICTFMIFRSLFFFERTWIFLLLGLILTFFYSAKYYQSRIFVWGLLYLLIVFFDFLKGDQMFNNLSSAIFNESMLLILPTAITYSLIKRNDMTTMKNIVVVFFCFFVFTTVVSFIIDLTFPGAIRRIVSLGYLGEDVSSYNYLFRIGLSNYYLPHAAPVLIPAVYFGATNKTNNKRIRRLLWCVLFSIIILTYLSGATTALLFSIIALITVLVLKRDSLNKNVVRIVLVFLISLPIITNSQIQSGLASLLVSVTTDTDFQGKALEFQSAVVYGDISGGNTEERIGLYTESWQGFLENVFIGTDQQTGGHSSALDRLAHLGLLGFIPFVLFFIAQMKMINQHIGSYLLTYYFLGMMFCITMLFLKYMFNWEMAIVSFTILPLTIVVFAQNNEMTLK